MICCRLNFSHKNRWICSEAARLSKAAKVASVSLPGMLCKKNALQTKNKTKQKNFLLFRPPVIEPSKVLLPEKSWKSYCSWEKQPGSQPSVTLQLVHLLWKEPNLKCLSVCLNEKPFPDLYIVIKAGSDSCTHLLYAAKEAKRKKNNWLRAANDVN